jgi:hypothetical protein
LITTSCTTVGVENERKEQQKEQVSIESEHSHNIGRIQHAIFMATNYLHVLDEVIPEHLNRLKADEQYRQIDNKDFTKTVNNSSMAELPDPVERFLSLAAYVNKLDRHYKGLKKSKT